ncbi:uncharacterized protein AMSG_07006 [Thecamonas trahens ATCC 50062]|uniref:Uncharacterized protein n=1 Tax=Thecamonas trahens ATCC 50062 TaxID=461836 RepID=A0A0L0DFG1_THETB|nr:hypothetical protein AMSG_07006 [Thecamonas trahens ATCC 50062]KNC51029.1 hypothetical protein AMSG_07006 [Thecamonas trahens ATCC 50062]|eukprot:XP_013756496.1 hypothetical protein AMSG_07006 [Thecamonas trahens ATCC 50062]
MASWVFDACEVTPMAAVEPAAIEAGESCRDGVGELGAGMTGREGGLPCKGVVAVVVASAMGLKLCRVDAVGGGLVHASQMVVPDGPAAQGVARAVASVVGRRRAARLAHRVWAVLDSGVLTAWDVVWAPAHDDESDAELRYVHADWVLVLPVGFGMPTALEMVVTEAGMVLAVAASSSGKMAMADVTAPESAVWVAEARAGIGRINALAKLPLVPGSWSDGVRGMLSVVGQGIELQVWQITAQVAGSSIASGMTLEWELTLHCEHVLPDSALVEAIAARISRDDEGVVEVVLGTDAGASLLRLECEYGKVVSVASLPADDAGAAVFAACFSPEGVFAAVGTASGDVELLSIYPSCATGARVGRLRPRYRLDAEVMAVVPTTSGALVAWSSQWEEMRILAPPQWCEWRPERSHAFPPHVARTARFILYLKQKADAAAIERDAVDAGADPALQRVTLTDLPTEVLFRILVYVCGVTLVVDNVWV